MDLEEAAGEGMETEERKVTEAMREGGAVSGVHREES